jgi:hypothetical protein
MSPSLLAVLAGKANLTGRDRHNRGGTRRKNRMEIFYLATLYLGLEND